MSHNKNNSDNNPSARPSLAKRARACFVDSRGGDNPPPPPPPEGLDGSWRDTLPDGTRLRSPVAVDFAGTIQHDKPDPKLDAAGKAAFVQAQKKAAQDNEAVLKQAVLILSQSDTGRALLAQMTQDGYRIVFDDRRTGSRGAGGLCDPNDKILILKSHDDPEYLALLIAHEAVHAGQNSRQDLFPSSRHKPEVGIKLSFAIEADAYAQQTQVAFELAHGSARGPERQWRLSGPLRQMRHRFGDLTKAGDIALRREGALEDGSLVAAVFDAFYDNFYLRSFYEDAHVDWVNDYAPTVRNSLNHRLSKNFVKDVESDWIKGAILHRGRPYLVRHRPQLDFNDARHSGVCAKTALAITAFYDSFLPARAKPELKKFGLYIQHAANQNRDPATESESAPKEKGKKVKAPRKRKRDFW